MSVIQGDLETSRQPPMVIPLRHFVVGIGFLLLGVVVAIGSSPGIASGYTSLAHVHLLLAGWVCVTIMGAMTQFVPVWSGVSLHSRRLAAVQLWLVVVGLLGFAASLVTGHLVWSPIFGGLMVLGFWTFVYNVGRTLWELPSYDVTERHFALALGFFLLVTTLGILLAIDFTRSVFPLGSTARSNVVEAHATLAVFGAVVTTIIGALYQLGTMFTQTELHGIDVPLRRLEELGYPTGVVLLATGRLVDSVLLGRLGGVLVTVTLLGFSLLLGRRLYETRVDRTPMLSRYAVVVPALGLWSLLALRSWLGDPLARTSLFGAPGTVHLLVLGVIGFVVLGTLYHVVPFIVWVHRYSDLLGYEPVPMIDDLYSGRLASVDFVSLVAGTGVLVAADAFRLRSTVAAVGGGLVLLGASLFLVNVLLVIRSHSPYSIPGVLLGASASEEGSFGEDVNDPSGGR